MKHRFIVLVTLFIASTVPAFATYGPAGPNDFPNERDEILSLQEQLKSAKPGKHAVLKRRIKVKTDRLKRRIKRLQAKFDKQRKRALAPLERESEKKMRYLRRQMKKAGAAAADIAWHKRQLLIKSFFKTYTDRRVRHDETGIKGKEWHRKELKGAIRRHTNARNNMSRTMGELKQLDSQMRAIR